MKVRLAKLAQIVSVTFSVAVCASSSFADDVASKPSPSPTAAQEALADDAPITGSVNSSPSHKRRRRKVVQPVAAAVATPEPPVPSADSCGPGWMVTQKRTLSATTTRQSVNLGGILPTFGMTSGTSGCARMPLSTVEESAVRYTYTNKDSLILAMAEGQGEVLTAYAQTLGCRSDLNDGFSKMTQSHYREITHDGQAGAWELYQNVKVQLGKDPVLSQGCHSV